ncbi:MAG: tyrosine-type recombinase/integrase [Flavobacteriales bacterium]|nr:tyrosine-type recombinase/integrase [Flavobacteriales bacterium]
MESFKHVSLDFLRHCIYEKGLNEKTLKAYQTDIRQFREFLALSAPDIQILEIDKSILLAYLKNLHEKQYKVKSIKRKLACIKAVFNYFEFENDDFINPFRKIRIKLKEPFVVPTVMNFNEVRAIFQNLYSLKLEISPSDVYQYRALVRDLAVLELFFATGLRVSELTNLKYDNINLDEGVLKVHGKGGKDRVIQLCNAGVIKCLKEYESLFINEMKSTGWFFINRLSKRLSEQSARNTVKKYASAGNTSKLITPHTYRHTFATMLLEEGVDIKYIQKLLGHSSIMTTQIYTHVTSVKQREILATKHPRNRMSMMV